MRLADAVALLSQVPFAILVAAYVLIRIEPILDRMTQLEAAELEIMRALVEKFLGPEVLSDTTRKLIEIKR